MTKTYEWIAENGLRCRVTSKPKADITVFSHEVFSSGRWGRWAGRMYLIEELLLMAEARGDVITEDGDATNERS